MIHFKSWQLPKIIASPFTVDEATIRHIFTAPYETWAEETIAIWDAHSINLDETQDAWRLIAYPKQGCVVFVGQGWRDPCPAEDIGRIFTATADYSSIIGTINDCLLYFGREQ